MQEENGGVKGQKNVAIMDQDSEAIKERYHSNLSEGEEWKEMKLSWKELPQVYLKLSKSRLTCESVFYPDT